MSLVDSFFCDDSYSSAVLLWFAACLEDYLVFLTFGDIYA